MFTCIFIYENISVNLGMNSADTLYLLINHTSTEHIQYIYGSHMYIFNSYIALMYICDSHFF